MAGTIPSSTAWRARLLEDRDIVEGDLQGTRSSATHGAAPMAGKRDQSQLTSRPEFLALLSSGPTNMGKAAVAGEERETGGIGRPTSDQNPAGHRGNDDGMSVHGDPTQHGKPQAVRARDPQPDAREG